jgi:hypothetical protein
MIKRLLSILLILIVTGCHKSGSDAVPKPGAATLVSPVQNQTCTTGVVLSATQSNVSFSWTASSNTGSYSITIKNLLTNTSVTTAVNGTSATETLLRNTPYSWYITSISAVNNITTNSATWKFYNSGAGVVTYPPFPAQITAPTFSQVITSSGGAVNLTWTGSSVSNNIISYTVYFGTSSTPPVLQSGVTNSFINHVTVAPNTIYYWRVVTIDANQNTSDSGIYNFFVKS